MNYREQLQAIDKAIIEDISNIVAKVGTVNIVSEEDVEEGEFGELYLSVIDLMSGQVVEVRVLSVNSENIVVVDDEHSFSRRELHEFASVEDRMYLLSTMLDTIKQ